VTERAADRRECDAGVPARGLGDGVARRDPVLGIGAADDVERHPVLDAAGDVEVLGLGVDDAPLAAIGPTDEVNSGVEMP
jgi:hypothetical protein